MGFGCHIIMNIVNGTNIKRKKIPKLLPRWRVVIVYVCIPIYLQVAGSAFEVQLLMESKWSSSLSGNIMKG